MYRYALTLALSLASTTLLNAARIQLKENLDPENTWQQYSEQRTKDEKLVCTFWPRLGIYEARIVSSTKNKTIPNAWQYYVHCIQNWEDEQYILRRYGTQKQKIKHDIAKK